jgi:hypothetical protein
VILEAAVVCACVLWCGASSPASAAFAQCVKSGCVQLVAHVGAMCASDGTDVEERCLLPASGRLCSCMNSTTGASQSLWLFLYIVCSFLMQALSGDCECDKNVP